MYIPKFFEEKDNENICLFIENFPLATMICSNESGLEANHIPLILQKDKSFINYPYSLIGHFAKNNPVWQNKNNTWLIIFSDNGNYISPSWYPTKAITHKEVPTWNYRAVHILGKMHLIEASLEKIEILDKLTQHFESKFSQPWQLSDAPKDFLEKLLKEIVTFKIEITNIQSKFKISQNKSQENIQGVIFGLEKMNKPSAENMVEAMKGLFI